jgi:hypothetical protein
MRAEINGNGGEAYHLGGVGAATVGGAAMCSEGWRARDISFTPGQAPDGYTMRDLSRIRHRRDRGSKTAPPYCVSTISTGLLGFFLIDIPYS